MGSVAWASVTRSHSKGICFGLQEEPITVFGTIELTLGPETVGWKLVCRRPAQV